MKRILVLVLFVMMPCQLFAQTDKPEDTKDNTKEIEKFWTSSVGLSFVTVSGNTESQTLSITGDAVHETSTNKLEINAGTVYGKSAGEKTAEYWYGKTKYDSNITQKTYLFGVFNAKGNKLSGYDYRLSAYPGAGYKFLEGKHSLIAEAGPGFFYEKRIGEDEDDLAFFSGRAYTKYIFKITKVSSFSQDAEYLYNFEDEKDYRVNSNTTLTAKISELLSLKLNLLIQHANQPPEGNERTDMFTSTSLVFTF